jgi:hypothetical protein
VEGEKCGSRFVGVVARGLFTWLKWLLGIPHKALKYATPPR